MLRLDPNVYLDGVISNRQFGLHVAIGSQGRLIAHGFASLRSTPLVRRTLLMRKYHEDAAERRRPSARGL